MKRYRKTRTSEFRRDMGGGEIEAETSRNSTEEKADLDGRFCERVIDAECRTERSGHEGNQKQRRKITLPPRQTPRSS